MAFDACMMRAVLFEYNSVFENAKIEKVLQPRNDEIDLVLHSGKESHRLVINVGANAPRLQLSDTVKENPPKAPMLCMFLRKHLIGGRITSARQINFDRIAEFTVSCYDEMGFATTKKLVVEIMGKYANLIVLDSEDKIMTAFKMIDFSDSDVRQILPGLKYQIPDKPEKLSPLEINKDLFFEKLSSFPKEKTVEKFITGIYSGIATQIAREISYRAFGKCDVPLSEISGEKLYLVFESWQKLLKDNRYEPTMAINGDGKPCDYSYMPITYLQGMKTESRPTLRELFDACFLERDRIERINQRAKNLITLLSNARARTERKLAIQREALLDSEKGSEYKKYADLITANIYKLSRGMKSFKTVDYYEEDCPEIEIMLDEKLDPSKNAQKMYKLYNKAKNAKAVLSEQILIWERELLYLDSVKEFLDRAETEQDLIEIREELYRSGYSSKLKDYKPQKKIKLCPMKFETSGGFLLLVGRNNVQNDELTFKIADKGDLWFHVKDLPGSHVILVCDGEEPGDSDYTEACQAAAYYSKATGDAIAVDYTRVKNIKKPQGAKPGFVIYKTNYTAFVDKKFNLREIKNG